MSLAGRFTVTGTGVQDTDSRCCSKSGPVCLTGRIRTCIQDIQIRVVVPNLGGICVSLSFSFKGGQ